MIKKLESAGLGFYVRATETQQKLGIYDDCVLITLVPVVLHSSTCNSTVRNDTLLLSLLLDILAESSHMSCKPV